MNTRRITIIAFFALLTYISGLFRIPVGPVPITLQTVMVILTGLLLVPKDAFTTMVLHMILKILLEGVPLVIGPTFGFILGYILAATMTSIYSHNNPRKRKHTIIAIIISSICPYLLGLPYMAFILNVVNGAGMNLIRILQTGMLIFIPGDTLKAIFAYFLAKRLYPIFDSYSGGGINGFSIYKRQSFEWRRY